MPRPKHGNPSHRVYEPGKRHFELIASVSRSSGLEKDGDALRDFRTQEDYREFIQGKVDEYWKLFPYGRPTQDTKRRDEIQGNILIQFRKLREGILSTKRHDAFALEVYETSLYLSALFASPVQASSIIPQLLPDLYTSISPPPQTSLYVVLISLLHFLVTAYPSQSRFFEHLGSIPHSFLPKSSPARQWIWDLARALRYRDFARLEHLTSYDAFIQLLPHMHGDQGASTKSSHVPANLALAALSTLVNSLRNKARDTVWAVIRAAYRELSCLKDGDGISSSTATWLCRSLILRTVSSATTKEDDDEMTAATVWLEAKSQASEVKPKEGAEGRWIVCKPKPRA